MSHRTILQPRSRLSMGTSSRSTHRSSNMLPSSSSSSSLRTPVLEFHQRPYEEQQRIERAATISEENELLLWSSIDRNESLSQTKLHFEREMLLIDSDAEAEEEEARRRGRDHDDDSGGSVEWEETLEWDSDDVARMKPGIVFGPGGWWDPKVHRSAEERMQAVREERERREEEERVKSRVKVPLLDEEDEDLLPVRKGRSPRGTAGRRKTSGQGSGSGGGTPGKRKSGGKRAFTSGGAGGSSQG